MRTGLSAFGSSAERTQSWTSRGACLLPGSGLLFISVLRLVSRAFMCWSNGTVGLDSGQEGLGARSSKADRLCRSNLRVIGASQAVQIAPVHH